MSDALMLDGKPLPGFFLPGKPGAPALVVIHEYWGLNPHVREIATRFSKEGFTVFAADLYDGLIARDAAAASKAMGAMDWKVAVPLLGKACEALKARDPGVKVGVLGFCLGGALSFAAAAAQPGFDACVPFYGIPDTADFSKIRARVLGHFATVDQWCSPERVDALEQKLKDGKVAFEFHRYDANHAFFNDTRPEVFSPANAKLAWDRSLKFLHTVLG